jgi:uncharacterized glyoxalase superfamily protein PhnB
LVQLREPDGLNVVNRATTSSLAAALRYRDIASASDWLCAAFGFQKHFVVTSDTGAVDYVQLIFGDAMLMLAPVRDFALDQYMKQPEEIGGAETQSCYLVVSDADAHYARAKASGAEIIVDIQHDGIGGRSYSCRDPEGHIWSFGTYDPWQMKPPGGLRAARSTPRGAKRWVAAAGLAATVGLAVMGTAMYGSLRQPETGSLETRPTPRRQTLESVARENEERTARAMQERLSVEQSAREGAEQAAREAREQLGRERIERERAERTAEQATKRVDEERRARQAAENSAGDARQEIDRLNKANAAEGRAQEASEIRAQLDREREAKEIAEHTAEVARRRAFEEQNTREAVERIVIETRGQLDRERVAKETAEHNLEQALQLVSEQRNAAEAAERTAQEVREQLSREQSAKNAAWKAAAQLRRQLNQTQSQEAATETQGAGPKAKPKVNNKKAKPQSPE